MSMTTQPAVARSTDVVVPRLEPAKSEPGELIIYWRAVAKRKWWILGTAVIFAALAFVAVSRMTPVFRATVTLMIEQNKAKLVSIEEVYSGVSPNREHYQTQAEMLKSPALASRVIEKLRLVDHADFDPRQRKPGLLQSVFGLGAGADEIQWTAEKLQAAVLGEFQRRVAIEPVRATQLVKLSFDSADRKLAAQVANTIAEMYIESDIATRSRLTQRAGDWLAERLTTLKGSLEQSERALQQFREQQGLLDTKGLAQSGATRQIEELTRVLNDATQRRVDAENLRKQLESAQRTAESSPVVMRTAHIDRLKELESAAEKNVAALSKQYGPEHPRMIHAERQLNEARRNTRAALDTLVASFTKEYEVAAADEAATRKALAAAKGSVRDINRKEFQLEALEQDVTANRQIYDKFLSRYRETRAASDTQSSVVARVIDPAVAPKNPYKPRREQIVQFAFALGILFAAITALLRERIDSTITSADDVQEKLGLPALTVLPMLSGKQKDAAGRHYLDQPGSVFSEAVRTARTSILLSAVDERNKVLLVTSSVPSEGKSSFAANLALAKAQTRKTVLIEGDLRRPSLVGHLGLSADKPGLGHLLAGSASLSECVQNVPGSSLYVLPAGSIVENALEVLSSARFRELLSRISAACEIVIIDSPPTQLVSDAIVLSRMATGVIFVLKARATPYPLARRSIKSLHDAGANILGVALNQLDFKKAHRYDGAYTGYANEHGAHYGRAA